MNKKDLTNALSESIGKTKKESKEILEKILKVFKDTLSEGEPVKLVGFGTFQVVERKARKGRNPQTGEEIDIPAKKVVRFKPGKNLKELINK